MSYHLRLYKPRQLKHETGFLNIIYNFRKGIIIVVSTNNDILKELFTYNEQNTPRL